MANESLTQSVTHSVRYIAAMAAKKGCYCSGLEQRNMNIFIKDFFFKKGRRRKIIHCLVPDHWFLSCLRRAGHELGTMCWAPFVGTRTNETLICIRTIYQWAHSFFFFSWSLSRPTFLAELDELDNFSTTCYYLFHGAQHDARDILHKWRLYADARAVLRSGSCS